MKIRSKEPLEKDKFEVFPSIFKLLWFLLAFLRMRGKCKQTG